MNYFRQLISNFKTGIIDQINNVLNIMVEKVWLKKDPDIS